MVKDSRSLSASPIWLSHHHQDSYERCVRVGQRHVCRRCLVLYPVALLVSVLTAVAWTPTGLLSTLAMWVLPVPVVIEWIGEHLFGWSYRPRRQSVLTAIAAPGLGVALGIHFDNPFALEAVLPMVVFGGVCFLTAMLGAVANRHAEGVQRVWEETFEASEARRTERLHAMLGEHTD